jgi:hypothetical protein
LYLCSVFFKKIITLLSFLWLFQEIHNISFVLVVSPEFMALTHLAEREMQGTSKWEGSVTVPVAASVERVWEIASDFCGLRKWHPFLSVCERVEGTEQTPGCVRYCAANSSGDNNGGGGVMWVKEKLICMDSRERRYSYAVIDGNMGLHGYEVTVQVMPTSSGEGEEDSGQSAITWSFQLDPLANYREEEFTDYLRSVLIGMAKTLQDLCLASSQYS